jgi:hypothetical protein
MSKAKVILRPNFKYRQVRVDTLNKGRRGKHHDLVVGIFRELEILPRGSAVEVPLESVDTGLANLRSAVHRVSLSNGLEIRTLADEKNFYVWNK